MRGQWTRPGQPVPSSHLITSTIRDDDGVVGIHTRCGKNFAPAIDATDEVPGTGKTCEQCLRFSRRDS